MALELIIHADDYGLTGSVSRGILAAHAHGVVTSASILMTHVTPKELAWAKAEPTLDFGLHLNLTSGAPLSALSDVPHMAGPRRTFAIPRRDPEDPADPHKRFDFSQVPLEELLLELTAQVEAGLASPVPLSHLDTHHHIHRDERIFGLVLDLASEYGLAVRALDAAQRERCARVSVPTTGHFLGGWFGHGAITAEHLLDAITALPDGTSAELMCHPGEPSEELAILSSYATERAEEMAVLTDPAVRRALRDRVHLIGWGDLVRHEAGVPLRRRGRC